MFDIFRVFYSLFVMAGLLYEPYRRHCPEGWRQSCAMHFCMLVELAKLDAFAWSCFSTGQNLLLR